MLFCLGTTIPTDQHTLCGRPFSKRNPAWTDVTATVRIFTPQTHNDHHQQQQQPRQFVSFNPRAFSSLYCRIFIIASEVSRDEEWNFITRTSTEHVHDSIKARDNSKLRRCWGQWCWWLKREEDASEDCSFRSERFVDFIEFQIRNGLGLALKWTRSSCWVYVLYYLMNCCGGIWWGLLLLLFCCCCCWGGRRRAYGGPTEELWWTKEERYNDEGAAQVTPPLIWISKSLRRAEQRDEY